MNQLMYKIMPIFSLNQKDCAKKWRMENIFPKFYITKDNFGLEYIELSKDVLKDSISLVDIENIIRTSSEHKNKRIIFKCDENEKKLKTLLLIVANQKIELETKKSILFLFFKDMQLFKISPYLDVLSLRYIKTGDFIYKELAMYVLSISKERESYTGGTLKSILDCLIRFDYDSNDYDLLLNLFERYKRDISNNFYSQERSSFFSFLRNKINYKDWKKFEYIHLNKKLEVNTDNLYESVLGEKLHLKINLSKYKELFPMFSIESDMNLAFEKATLLISAYREKLGIKEINILFNHLDKFEVYFLSKKELNSFILRGIYEDILVVFARQMNFDVHNFQIVERIIDKNILNDTLSNNNLEHKNIKI